MYRIETGVIAIAVITLIVTAFVAVGIAAPARAADDKTVCVDRNASHDDAIAACGRLMDGDAAGRRLIEDGHIKRAAMDAKIDICVHA
jgi:hypothetical protein